MTFTPKEIWISASAAPHLNVNAALHRTISHIGTILGQLPNGWCSSWMRHLRKESCVKVIVPHWNQVKTKAKLVRPNSIVYLHVFIKLVSFNCAEFIYFTQYLGPDKLKTQNSKCYQLKHVQVL